MPCRAYGTSAMWGWGSEFALGSRQTRGASGASFNEVVDLGIRGHWVKGLLIVLSWVDGLGPRNLCVFGIVFNPGCASDYQVAIAPRLNLS
jgi:hypothetical protein